LCNVVWGVLWLIIALIFFAAGIIVGLVAFKQSAAQQKEDAKHFLPVPHSGTPLTANIPSAMMMLGLVIGTVLFV
jgi:F0F1-type ATP synthase membrane subunit c/vacuolar-type H+-ATPase subunit K